MRVIATERGYYGNQRREPGDEFGLADRKHFSAKWMEPVGWDPDDADAEPVAEPKPEPDTTSGPAPVNAPKPDPEPIKASTETTVTPPKEQVKPISPITGKATA